MSVHQLVRESVLLTLIKGTDRIDRTAIIAALGQIISVSDIDSLGNIGNFFEWYVIFNSKNARQDILKYDVLNVGDQVFMISEPYKHVKIIRLLNVPTSVSDEDIRSIASHWGGIILNIESEKMPRPYEGIKIFVRRLRIRFSCRQDEDKVPITIRFGGCTFVVQLEGRQKVCYRCCGTGHLKAKCTVMKCQKCYELGHDDQNCQQKISYATAVVSTPIDAESTPSQAVQGSLTVEPTAIGQTTISSALLPQQRVRVCGKCRQPGHKSKKCLQQANTLNQLNEHGGNDHMNSIDDVPQETPSTPVVSSENENNLLSANSIQAISDNDNVNDNQEETVTTIASGLQHRIMYEVYKQTANDCKRTCADRSIDSDLDTDPKKLHTHDSFTSILGDNDNGNEEGEVIEH